MKSQISGVGNARPCSEPRHRPGRSSSGRSRIRPGCRRPTSGSLAGTEASTASASSDRSWSSSNTRGARRAAVLRIGVTRHLDEPDRRRRRAIRATSAASRSALAHGLRGGVDRNPARLARQDAGPAGPARCPSPRPSPRPAPGRPRPSRRRRMPGADGFSRLPAAATARWANGSASAVRRNLSKISARSSARSGASRPLARILSTLNAASRSRAGPTPTQSPAALRKSRLPLSPLAWSHGRARSGLFRRSSCAARRSLASVAALPAGLAGSVEREIHWPAPIALLSASRARSGWSGCCSANVASRAAARACRRSSKRRAPAYRSGRDRRAPPAPWLRPARSGGQRRPGHGGEQATCSDNLDLRLLRD